MANELACEYANDRVSVDGYGRPVLWAEVNIATFGSAQEVLAAVTGRKLRVLGLCIVWVDTASTNGATHTWQSAATVRIDGMPIADNGTLEVNRLPYGWFVETNAGEALNVLVTTSAGSGNLRGCVFYVEV
jgi:hypothetical protein